MGRKIKYREEIHWSNPIKKANPQPFLSEIIFPTQVTGTAAEEAKQTLIRFYCAERKGGVYCVDKLENYLENPDKQLLIIWGEVGIGKTWFVRYELTCGRFSEKYHSGVIDIMSGGLISKEDAIYKQLCPILESYFNRFFVSVKEALREYARSLVVHRIGEGSTQEDRDEIEVSATEYVNKWLSADYPQKQYVEILKDSLVYLNGPLLFLVIDNVDRALGDEQTILLDMIKRILRNNRIRVIVPLRKSTYLLSDRYRGLKEQPYAELELSALNLEKMIKRRFEVSYDGTDFNTSEPITDDKDKFRFTNLYDRVFKSESGKLILSIAGKNAREALLLTDRLIHSDHLNGMKNIGNNQFAIAALMLKDTTELEPSYPYVINLFDNEEPRYPGNVLIRFRVLEYFRRERVVSAPGRHFLRSMDRLGYEEGKLKEVLSLFLGTSLIYSNKGLIPEVLDDLEFDQLGIFSITGIGDSYWDTLIRMQWYYVSVKRGVAIDDKYISKDKENEFITHANLCLFFKDQENEERFRIKMWESKHGGWEEQYIGSPSEIARRALRKGRDYAYVNGSRDKIEENSDE